MSENKLTPMMQQFYEIKAKYPDFILFFRLGDFYEMFDEDAEITAGILDIALTRRSNQKMCGIPYHALDNYLYKMIKAGKKVAICEQVEEPGKNKIVKRDVVELVTPGTFTDAKHLNRNRDSFLVSLVVENGKAGIAACDASTGKFWVFREKAEPEKIGSFLKILQPSEIIIPRHYPELEEAVKQYYHTLVPEYYFSPPVNEVLLLEHFQVGTLKGLGLGEEVLAGSAGAVLRYLKDNLFQDVKHLTEIRHIHSEDFVYLPESTLRNLEILEPLFQNTVDTSLFTNQNATMTAMGAREFRNWLVHPLRNREKILKRQEQVQFFKEKPLVLKDIRSILKQIPDVERMLSRISLKRSSPKEAVSFKEGLKRMEEIKKMENLPFREIEELSSLREIIGKVEEEIVDEPPVSFEEGGVIREGIDPELDEYRNITRKGKEYLLEIEQRERQKTGIQKLRLRYNKVIGYYLEVSKTHSAKVPENYVRKQSLVNAERYTIEELVEYETKIMNAREKVQAIEKRIFDGLLDFLIGQIGLLRENIGWIKKADIIASLAQIAVERNYIRPEISETNEIRIEEGRHPVVELFTDQFIPNSVHLDRKENRLLLITGPNMAGKSTYLRQVALITFMAHVGGFVPAKSARIGLTDQIFTRIGASDNLAGGESTFLVEMSETSQILRNATDRSLIIMDEIGRGTSTYDGLSLAWAIVEYLTDGERVRGKTLFATHYHELTVLGQEKGIQNHRMAVREWKDEIIFLHQVEKGAADKSYGIHVAEIAGIPAPVIDRARELLSSMEINLLSQEDKLLKHGKSEEGSLFAVPKDDFEKVKSRILGVDINHTTPLQALLLLEEVQRELRKKK